MAIISPLSSPEYVPSESPAVPISAGRPNARRLTHDLEEERVSLQPPLSWSFLDQYSDIVGVDKEEMDFPFDQNGDVLPRLPPFSHSSESSTSSHGSSFQSTHTLQDDISTPLPGREGVKGPALLGETLELGNCTYEIDQNNLTMTLSKLSKTQSNPGDRSLVTQSPFTCGVSSTPMRTCSHKFVSNLVTAHAASSVKSHLIFDNVMYKSPIHSPKSLHTKPIELDIKPADSTVDLEVGCDLDDTVNHDEELLKKTEPPSVAEVTARTIPSDRAASHANSKKPSNLLAPRRLSQRSVPPVVSGKLSKNKVGTRLLQGLRAVSSTSSLAQIPIRSSLLPTSFKSRSHERINTTASSGRSLKKSH